MMFKRIALGVVMASAFFVPAQAVQAQAKTHFFRYEYPADRPANPVGPTSPVPVAAPAAPTSPAKIRVFVPDAKALVWIADHPTVSTGMEREFQSPPIVAGTVYMYTLRIAWTESSKEMLQERIVFLRAGETTLVDFRANNLARVKTLTAP